MPAAATTAPPFRWSEYLPWVAAALLLIALDFASAGRRAVPQPLHADEAVQWSLAKEMSEGVAYSQNDDRFHGPALAVITNAWFRLTGISFTKARPEDLRFIPGAFFLLLGLAPLALATVSRPVRWFTALLVLMTGAGNYFGDYFIQETLLVGGLVWGWLLWESAEGPSRLPLLGAGACFGFALACKVTVVAYLGCFLLAQLALGRDRLTGARLGWVGLGLLPVWVCFQTAGFTDLAGLAAWAAQFQRSFSVAAGGADTLAADRYGAWWTVGGLLVGAWLLRSTLGWRRVPADVVLGAATLCFLFHLALPYKTPWLLFLPTALVLTLVLPVLLSAAGWRALAAAALAATFIDVSWRWGLGVRHTATLPSVVRFAEKVGQAQVAWEAKHGAGSFYVAIKDGHYWPLPYYLRRQNVGFGEFAGDERAPVRLLLRTDASQPKILGYETFPLSLRAGENYWVLVAAELASQYGTDHDR